PAEARGARPLTRGRRAARSRRGRAGAGRLAAGGGRGARAGRSRACGRRRGESEGRVRVDPALRPGLAFMTFHFQDEVQVNNLTIDATDPKSGTAEFKATAILIEKLEAPAPVA